MKVLWASEDKQGMNNCRFFANADFARETIKKEMLEDGFIYTGTQGSGKSFAMGFEKKPSTYLRWSFSWVEVEEE
ncbi:MAG TPA: hypothetical protein VMX17_13460 [Candidatus Glassbacteria bacterium]|jgi:hypothetical protein|nr:hypothetical protein [Candidatus Glassbacteria bacterium]